VRIVNLLVFLILFHAGIQLQENGFNKSNRFSDTHADTLDGTRLP